MNSPIHTPSHELGSNTLDKSLPSILETTSSHYQASIKNQTSNVPVPKKTGGFTIISDIKQEHDEAKIIDLSWKCKECGVKENETPLKRKGPDGKRSICNACYVRWRVRCERAERGSARPTPQQIANTARMNQQTNVPVWTGQNNNTNAKEYTNPYAFLQGNITSYSVANNWNQYVMYPRDANELRLMYNNSSGEDTNNTQQDPSYIATMLASNGYIAPNMTIFKPPYTRNSFSEETNNSKSDELIEKKVKSPAAKKRQNQDKESIQSKKKK